MLGAMSASAPRVQEVGSGILLGEGLYGRSSAPAWPAQPFHLPPLIADVRLDNHDDLIRELTLPRDTPDAAVLQHGWLRWRSAMLDHLLGAFAFAVWDASAKALFLARDHAGERPLHFARIAGNPAWLAFASLPLGVCALPAVGRHIDVEQMALHVARLLQTTQTLFKGVEILPPGSWLKATPAGIEIRRYWHPCQGRPIRYASDEDYVEDFRERFERAVAVRLPHNAEAASQLSGGLDSSSVTAEAARLLAGAGRRLTAFTAVPLREYGDQDLHGRFGDEGPAAAEVAAVYANLDHVLVYGGRRDPLASWQRHARLAGAPVDNPTNMLWLDAILEEMQRRGARVLLQGAAGNATISFGGIIGLSSLFRRGRWWRLFQLTRQLRAGGHTSWRGAASWAMAGSIPPILSRSIRSGMRQFTLDYCAINPRIVAEYQLRDRALAQFSMTEQTVDSLRRAVYEAFDYGTTVAAVAAGWQIEQRDPTQDKHVYEFCHNIPVEQYLTGGQDRSLIRRAMQGRLPESTLRRTARGLQSADWFLTVRKALPAFAAELDRIAASPLACHILDVPRLRSLVRTFPVEGYTRPEIHEAYHLALTRGIVVGSFLADHDPAVRTADAEKPGVVPGS